MVGAMRSMVKPGMPRSTSSTPNSLVPRDASSQSKNRKEVRLTRIGNQVLAPGEEVDIT